MKYLASQERLVTNVRMHWAVLMRLFLETAAAVVAALGVNVLFATQGADGGLVVTLLWYVALFMILRMLWRLVDWHVTRIMITNKRLLRVSGIFYRKVQTMPLEKITDMTYNRDPLGRLLGYGEFVVETAGDDAGALAKMQYLPRPDRLYLTLCDMTFGGAPSPASDD